MADFSGLKKGSMEWGLHYIVGRGYIPQGQGVKFGDEVGESLLNEKILKGETMHWGG